MSMTSGSANVTQLLPNEPPFLVVASWFVVEFHERGDKCVRCRDGACPRLAHAYRIMQLHGQALRIVRTGL